MPRRGEDAVTFAAFSRAAKAATCADALPARLPGPVVKGQQHGFSPQLRVIGSLVIFHFVIRSAHVQVSNAEAVAGIHVEQPGLRIETRRPPVGGGTLKKDSVARLILLGFGNRLPSSIDAPRPVLPAVLHGRQTLAGGAVEQEIIAAA